MPEYIQKTKHSKIMLQSAGMVLLVIVAVYWMNAIISPTDTASYNGLNPTNASVTPPPLPNSLEGLKGVSEIQGLAAADSNGARVNGIKLEQKDNTLMYGVRLSDGRVRYYDAATGAMVTEAKPEGALASTQAIPDGFVATISIDQARSIAIDRVPLESVVLISLESDKDRLVYCVQFSGGSRVFVSADDGSVTRIDGPPHTATESQPAKSNPEVPASGASDSTSSPEQTSTDVLIQPAPELESNNPPEPEPVDSLRVVPIESRETRLQESETPSENNNTSYLAPISTQDPR